MSNYKFLEEMIGALQLIMQNPVGSVIYPTHIAQDNRNSVKEALSDYSFAKKSVMKTFG